jgi:hypothetical protein
MTGESYITLFMTGKSYITLFMTEQIYITLFMTGKRYFIYDGEKPYAYGFPNSVRL